MNQKWFEAIGLSGVIDILFMTLLFYVVLVWFKKTRAAFVFTGIIIVAGLYLLSRLFSLTMTATLFERFFAAILIMLAIIFQEELRNFFEKIAIWSLERRLMKRKPPNLPSEDITTLVRCLFDFSREKIGSLIVLTGKDHIGRHLAGGVELFGEFSEPLIKSLFDPNSLGHDGAVIMQGNRILQFSCLLPITKNLKKLGNGGTRHAAALGISEMCDALAIVVSEERGTVSAARWGDIQVVDAPESMIQILEDFHREVHPVSRQPLWIEFVQKNYREKLVAILLSTALWFVLVYGAKSVYRSFTIPIELSGLPQGWSVKGLEPKTIDITLRGSLRSFYFLTKDRIIFHPDFRLDEGQQRIRVYSNQLDFPKNIELEDVDPKIITLRLKKSPESPDMPEVSPPSQNLP